MSGTRTSRAVLGAVFAAALTACSALGLGDGPGDSRPTIPNRPDDQAGSIVTETSLPSDSVQSSALPSSATPSSTVLDAQVGSAGIGDPLFPGLGNGGYDITHYELVLDLLDETGIIDATATITLIPTVDLSSLNLDLVGLDVLDILRRERPVRPWLLRGHRRSAVP